MKKIPLLAVFAIVLAFSVVAACGTTSSPTTTSTSTVTMSGVTFSTNAITITKGSTIAFTTDHLKKGFYLCLNREEIANVADSF